MRSLMRLLNAPYPRDFSGWKRELMACGLIGVFISLFLVVFEPFGLSRIEDPNKTWMLASFGITTAVVSFITVICLDWALVRDRRSEHYRLWQRFAILLPVPALIGSVNYFHAQWLFDTVSSCRGFLQSLGQTFAIGFFPILAVVFFDWFRLFQRHARMASGYNATLSQLHLAPGPAGAFNQAAGTAPLSAPEAQAGKSEVEANKPMLLFQGENQNECLSLPVDALYFAEACGNYVEIAWRSPQGTLQKTLLRTSLKAIESQIMRCETRDIIRCHRSFLVNISRIAKAEGNALGFELSMDAFGLLVPVSRSYVDRFRRRHRAA